MGRVGKPRSERLRGDLQLRLRPCKGKAARRRKRRFEVGCSVWVRRKGGRTVKRAGLDERGSGAKQGRHCPAYLRLSRDIDNIIFSDSFVHECVVR